MSKIAKVIRYILSAIVLMLGILFVIKFSGPALLKFYIESGVGTCKQIPILCMEPQEEIRVNVNKEYAAELLPYKFPKMSIGVPKGFEAIQEKIKKAYYKKRKPKTNSGIIYLLYEEPGFFVNLFPILKKQGVNDDYEFFRRLMGAKISAIKTISDAFFIIMKGIFIPDLGEQNNAVMARFNMSDRRGFINYNLSKPDNYFDCNIFSANGDFFKIYIKDKGAKLDLEKVMTIISTVKR